MYGDHGDSRDKSPEARQLSDKEFLQSLSVRLHDQAMAGIRVHSITARTMPPAEKDKEIHLACQPEKCI